MDPDVFASMIWEGLIRALQSYALIAWNLLTANPWLLVIGAGALTIRILTHRSGQRSRRP